VRKTYSKKGSNIVEMNLSAIDAGTMSLHKVDSGALWGSVEDPSAGEGSEENNRCVNEGDFVENRLTYVVENLLIPINRQKGDDIPVSGFLGTKDGTMPLGTSAYEKRGIASQVPVWDKEECLQCNQCSFFCPHAVIRPFLLNEKEAGDTPDGFDMTDAKGEALKGLKYTIQVSKPDCTGCGCCAASCPASGKALKLIPTEDVATDMSHWNYALSVSDKPGLIDKFSVKGSQFIQPLLEFSGACAGCGETPYVKLLTQLYGDKMYFANGTGCLQAWGAAMPCMPYTRNKEGKGPAWSNSLFENNAEFSYGMCLSVKQQRESVASDVKKLQEGIDTASEAGQAIKKWFETYEDLDASADTSRALIEALSRTEFEGENKELEERILEKKNHLSKKTMWMVGGDGWAYDIGYGGLDHVFAMGEDVNVLVIDTEVYSNTGGQSSKATPVGAMAQFQASGKKTGKKDLGLLMMTYDNVYVAQCVIGANPGQLIKALKEAEEHRGPSIVIAYAPCINHGIKAGMEQVRQEMKHAVDSGYWCLYRYNPEKKEFSLDSKEPSMDLKTFLRGEVRYAELEAAFPENAEKLFAEAEDGMKEKYKKYKTMAQK
jgi:pyruvate-ferredoxin/flavodoxin oxidoreductase